MDVNKHVNNATYVKWILDSILTSSDHNQIIEFEINFMSELYLNNQFLVLATEVAGDSQYIVLNNAENNREICRARIRFNKN